MSSSASSSSQPSSGSAGAAGVVVATGKSVASPTSCSWQQVSENGKCYVEPRTCYDCLNKPLASGEECALTPLGLCDSISQYDYTQDYRRPGAAGPLPIHYNYFPETNTTYCEPNDSNCNLCQENSFALNDNPSTYCEGTNKCVCIKVCETTNWRNEMLERLRSTLAARNETTNTTCPIAANTSLIYEGSGSTGSDNEVSPSIVNAQVDKNAYAKENACRWYQNQTFCDQPRTCYDCLNVPVYSGSKCTINPLGFCAPFSEYDFTHDYRVRPSPSAGHYFPSTNATYCEADDTVCAKCKETTFKESASGEVNPTQFCVGANDCVCVAFCESPSWKSLVKDATCSTVVVNISSERFSIATIALMMIGFTLIFTASAQLLTIMRNRRHARREQERREQRQVRSAFGNLQLQLDGWKTMCQELISKEQQCAGDRQGSGILTHGDGPTVEIEEGDGYRPMSPSHPGAHSSSATAAALATAETRPALQ